MRRYVLFAAAGLVSVLACGKTDRILSPNEGIVVVHDPQSFAAKGLTTVDFEGLPWNGSSCTVDPENAIDNPLVLEGVTFTDPYCLRTGYCSSPTCPSANIQLFLSQDATVTLPPGTKGALLQIEGLGDVPFALEVVDGKGRTSSVTGVGVLYGTTVIGFKSGSGIASFRVARVGPTPPDCPVAPCGPLVLSSLSYESR